MQVEVETTLSRQDGDGCDVSLHVVVHGRFIPATRPTHGPFGEVIDPPVPADVEVTYIGSQDGPVDLTPREMDHITHLLLLQALNHNEQC